MATSLRRKVRFGQRVEAVDELADAAEVVVGVKGDAREVDAVAVLQLLRRRPDHSILPE